ncbi:MAG: hypothetical protein QF681_11675 [Vicinamibacterales bacterium]|jgi:hypothetical protein|nr:hypothetical protein [Vicinamibacterales bacterium]
MASRLSAILDGIHELETQMERELIVAHDEWGYRFEKKRVHFDHDIRRRHRRLRRNIPRFLLEGSKLNMLTAPLIYSLLLPFAVLDAWVTLYQWSCFPIYGILRVPRASFVVIDRHKLSYLNGIEKVHCVLCDYANGVIAYVREVAARTEQYWCPIKHARRVVAPHTHYRRFPDYGDGEGYHRELPALRRELGRRGSEPPHAAGSATKSKNREPAQAVEDEGLAGRTGSLPVRPRRRRPRASTRSPRRDLKIF